MTCAFSPLRWMILFPLLLICGGLQAQSDYYFKQISVAEGLSMSSVRCVYRDHKGLVWIGTRNGLNCFDGFEMKNYFYHKEDSLSLPDNQIFFITEDSLFNLWIATGKGLVRYDRNTEEFVHVMLEGGLLNVRAFLLQEDEILFCGRNTLYTYSYSDKNLHQIPLRVLGEAEIPFHRALVLNSGELLLGARWGGLWRCGLKDGVLEKLPLYYENTVMAMALDSRQRLWVSPYGKGLRLCAPDGKELAVYTVANSGLSNDVILDLLEKDGKLWIATDGGGICVFDPDERTFTTICHVPGESRSLPANTITCLYNDVQDNLWVGTHREGLLRVKEVAVCTYKGVPAGNSYGLSVKTVNCLFEDREGIVWVGTDGGGVNRFDPSANTFRHYPATEGMKVVAITEYSDHKLFISCFNKGLFLFDKQSGNVTRFAIINRQVTDRIIGNGISVNLFHTPNDKFLLFNDKIYIYDRARSLSSTAFSSEPVRSQHGLRAFAVNDSVVWVVGEISVGKFNYITNHFSTYYTLSSGDAITSACCDANGKFWIATSNGLYAYDPVTGKERKIKTSLFQTVSSLVVDKKNRLWIGTQNKLYCYFIDHDKFMILGEAEGISPNEFLAKPVLLSEAGDTYMGGAAGLVRIKHDISLDAVSLAQMEVIDVYVDGVRLPPSAVNTGGELTVPWNHSSIVVKVYVKEKELFREKMYRYRVGGLNKVDIETPDRAFTIGTLLPGQYALTAQCNTRDGSWTVPVRLLNIIVPSPWWQTTWFLLLCSMAGIILVVALFVVYTRKKENLHKWELKEQEQKIYEQKVQFLINISHELRTPLTLIYAPLKRILDKYKENDELKGQLTAIYKQTKQMKNIINMVLDVRKMELGPVSLQIIRYDLNRWAEEITDDFKNEFANKNVNLDFSPDKNLSQVPFDKGKCEIILNNFLSNALKFSEPDTTVIVCTELKANRVRITVSDQGIGLDNVDIQQLFKRFYQGGHDRGGSGIGLSYSKLLVEMHGGSIGAERNPDKGATFWFELPLSTVSEDIGALLRDGLNASEGIPVLPIPDIQGFSCAAYSVIIVEDEPELRQFMKMTLKEYFKTVHAAANGEEALISIRQNHPDIIISDVMMPCMDGYELCRNVKEDIEISHIPVVLLTARSDSESKTIGYKTGADYYLAKPFEVDFLLTIIRTQLRNRERIRQRYHRESHFIIPQETTFSNADEKFLLKLNKLIEKELANPELDVEMLFCHMAVSRSSLYSKVKVLTGMGVNDYIIRARIEKALQLLVGSDLSIQEISDSSGFVNARYFSTMFKQMQGMTPSDFRKNHKKQVDNKGGQNSEK